MKYDYLTESEKLKLIKIDPSAYFRMSQVTDEMTLLIIPTIYDICEYSKSREFLNSLIASIYTSEEILFAIFEAYEIPEHMLYGQLVHRPNMSLELQWCILKKVPSYIQYITSPSYDLLLKFVYAYPKVASLRKFRNIFSPELRTIARILSI
jgi:hypothetical protein